MAPFVPTLHDIHHALSLLMALKLPKELALVILDQAHYWLERESESDENVSLVDLYWSPDYSAAYPYLYRPAYPQLSGSTPHLKVREIAFTIVSHDQGRTIEEGTEGTYQTSSWFEVSIVRPRPGSHLFILQPGMDEIRRRLTLRHEPIHSIRAASEIMRSNMEWDPVRRNIEADLVRRPSSVMEPQRLHCPEMMAVKPGDAEEGEPAAEEGEHAWYLQGNEVARAKSAFEGEMVRRYHVTWGCKDHPAAPPDNDAGRGDGFCDMLKDGDFICVWARAKRQDWENHVYGIRMVIRYMI